MTDAAKAQKTPAARTAITPTRAENFPEWYQQVVKAANMAEGSSVRGCYVLKPYGFAVWENIQKRLDAMIKAEDVQNAYFPLLIPLSFIAKEAEHIDGFAKECAVVTHHRLSAGKDGVLTPDPESILPEPLVVRPTSETIIGESMHNWIQSYRDLPLKLNQWCNVMRWEMRPRVFLRSAEFLWQEGHNAFATAEEADRDARRMLDVYLSFFETALAIPAIAGVKTPDERFPGAIETYTLEAFMQDGKALQSCTSHNLGQTFARGADIKFLDRDGTQKLAWTTSWGLSTRTIGGLIMTHADDDGMIMPPRVAPYQVAILPFLQGDEGKAEILAFCDKLKSDLAARGVTARVDSSDARSSDKMWAAIKAGVPLRVEVGAREMAEGQITYTRRDLGKEGKAKASVPDFLNKVSSVLDQMHDDLLARARARLATQIKDAKSLDDMRAIFAAGEPVGVRIDAALMQDEAAFEAIRKEFSVTPRCLPFADGGRKVIVGRSY